MHGKEKLRIKGESYIKMEIEDSASTFQNYQSFSDVIAERPMSAGENSEPIKSEEVKLSGIVFGCGVIMIMPNEESE